MSDAGDTTQGQPTIQHGRCHMCGYTLVGLPLSGACPECGTAYTGASAQRLQPWPSAFMICLRLGWPVLGILLAGGMITLGVPRNAEFTGSLLVWAMLVAIAINSYFQVRSMLRASLPETTRTRGPVAVLRKIGTTVCILILVVCVGGPLALGIGCLILLSQL